MHRAGLVSLGIIEAALAAVLMTLALQLPDAAMADRQVDRIDHATASTRKQVQLIHAQVDEARRKDFPQLARQYRVQSEAIVSNLRATAVDFQAIEAMSQALGAASKGLDGWADTLDARRYRPIAGSLGMLAELIDGSRDAVIAPRELTGAQLPVNRVGESGKSARDARLAEIRRGLDELTQTLERTTNQLESISQATYPLFTPAGLEMRVVWPDGARVVNDLRLTTQQIRDVRRNVDGAFALLPADPLQPLQTTAERLRQSQRQLLEMLAAWPARVETMQRSSAMLANSRRQLDGVLVRRTEYEQALNHSRQLSRAAEATLEATTTQFDARLAEQQQSLERFDNGLASFAETLPETRRTAGSMLTTGRLVLGILGGLVGLHALTLLLTAWRFDARPKAV